MIPVSPHHSRTSTPTKTPQTQNIERYVGGGEGVGGVSIKTIVMGLNNNSNNKYLLQTHVSFIYKKKFVKTCVEYICTIILINITK